MDGNRGRTGHPFFRGADINRSPHRIPAFRGGGYHPPAAPDTRSFVGAHSVRPRFRGCLRFLRHGNAGAAARAGVRPKGAQAVHGRAAARAGRRKRYTEPGGRPRGPPLRGRREGNAGSGGLKERGCRTRRAGLGPAPTGERNKARRADTFRPRYRISVFRGGGYAPLPHRIPAFRRGGYHPPAAPDSRPFVGAHSVRPRFRGCSPPPPTRKRWGAARVGVRPKGPQAVGPGGREGGSKEKVY